MAKLQYNVATFKGLNGTAVVYLAKTDGGTQFLTYKALNGDPAVEKWTYLSRTGLQSYMANGDASISSTVDVSKLADAAPSGVLDANGWVILDNAGDVPRLYSGQAFYSLKGTGISDYTGETGTAVGGTGTGGGSTVVISNTAKTLSETISEGVTWVTKNPLILIAALFLLSELFGLTNLLGLKKKKTARRRR